MSSELLLQILGWLVAGTGAVWALWEKVLPQLLEGRLRELQRKGELDSSREAHALDIEEAYVDTLVQSAIAAQADSMRLINQLITHVIAESTREMSLTREEMKKLWAITIREEAHFTLTNIEISRLVDSMHVLETELKIITQLISNREPSSETMVDEA